MVNSRSHCWCARRAPTEPRSRAGWQAAAAAVLLAGCGHAEAPGPATPRDAPPAPAAAKILCAPADAGFLRARLQGEIDAEIDWSSPAVAQCRGGRRPSGDGVRLLYKGRTADGDALLVVLGVGPLRAGESARNVPVNLTLVREGAGEFFATQGDDKCALDQVSQEPVAGATSLYRLTGRGYCTQPARALGGGAGSVLVPRFDVEAIVDYSE